VSIPSACLRSDRAVRGLLAVALFAGGLGGGCRGRARPDVLLISIDTTRADRLGCYGYGLPTTPNIDALAAEGALFTRAFATNPITLPSHSSLMTGTYPMFHGVRDNGTYVLRSDVTTLAEVLSAQGYDTGGVVGSFVLDSQFGLDQGFALYDDDVGREWSEDELAARTAHAFGFAERKANLVTTAGVRFIERPRRGPYFAWLHYFDPHQPINPPEPYRSRFADGYDAEIAFADEQIGQVFAALKKRGTYDDTLIVVTADHGEGLMEHGEPSHSLLVFDTTLHVPLIVKLPGQKPGRRVETLASLVDVMPTVLSALGLRVPAEVQGVSLLPWIRGAAPDARRTVYMESLLPRLVCGWGELRAIRSATEKLIWGPKPRLFRVSEDPGEVFDLAEKEPATVARLKAELEKALGAWTRPISQGSVSAPDAETVRRLAALGYVAGSVAASRGIRESLEGNEGRVDPYDKQSIFNLWTTALDDLRMGQVFQAIRKLEGIVAEDPKNTAALTSLATVYVRHARRPADAMKLYERSLAIDPYQEEALFYVARMRLAHGEADRALEDCQAILKFEPMSVAGLSCAGLALQTLGRTDEARLVLRQALEVDPASMSTLMTLGALEGRVGRHEEAGRYLMRARELQPNHPAVLYDLAVWYLQGGNRQEAAAQLRRVLLASPNDSDAQYVLGKILLEDGERDQARALLESAQKLTSRPERRAAISEMLQTLSP
jgi:arylsulfatase A-like enzyme/Flp pilus assembly protein TadD